MIPRNLILPFMSFMTLAFSLPDFGFADPPRVPKQRPDPIGGSGGSTGKGSAPGIPSHPVQFYAEMLPLSLGKIKERCEDDSLSPSEAMARLTWLKNCHPGLLVATYNNINGDDGSSDLEKIYIIESEWFYVAGDRSKRKVRPNYLTFGTSTYENPIPWYAPRIASASCDEFPISYQVLGECTSSCYQPEQTILLPGGETPIRDALEQGKDEVYSLSDDSTMENVSLELRKVKHYTRSATETTQPILTIKTESGGEIKVTKNHPLVLSNGQLREAGTLRIGDQLVLVDGQADPIRSLTEQDYHGRVFNIQPDTESELGQILVAQGFLSGSSWYQNDGHEYLNRLMLRRNVPATLFRGDLP